MDMENVRFHCDTEMDYLGVKDGEHWFECQICEEREATKHPNKPTGSPTKIGDRNYKN